MKNISDFIWDTEKINHFRDQIELFKSFRNKPINQENFFEAYSICFLLCDRIPLAVTLIKAPFIIRGRPTANNQLFRLETEISYNSTNTDKIVLGRFNRPGEPVFYGSLPDEIDPIHMGAAASLECCKRLVDPDNTDPFQYITFGKWEVTEPFYAINLCNDEKLLSRNPNLRNATLAHEQYIREQFPGVSSEFIIEFWKFLSTIAGKKHETENDHFLTTAFICAITKYREEVYKANTAGIIYPSTMTDNEGINIVLCRAAVNRFLKLKKVHMVKFIRKSPKAYDILQCTKEVDVINHEFNLIKEI